MTKFSPTENKGWKPDDSCPMFDEDLKFIDINKFPPIDANMASFNKSTENLFGTQEGTN